MRPLGGTVEFGESAETAVIREFQEELGIPVKTNGPPVFMENIYTHEGSLGHEILAIFEVTFPPDAYSGETRIEFKEDNGVTCCAEWYQISSLDLSGQPLLYPEGLKAHLLSTR